MHSPTCFHPSCDSGATLEGVVIAFDDRIEINVNDMSNHSNTPVHELRQQFQFSRLAGNLLAIWYIMAHTSRYLRMDTHHVYFDAAKPSTSQTQTFRIV
jgi:hypothetical protein